MALLTVKRLAAAALVAGLGGCNMVYSEQPLFTAADAAGAAPLKPGLWLSDDTKCRVRESQPVQTWPKCASWTVVRAGQLLEFKPPAWTSTDFVLASGEPRVLQAPVTAESGAAFMYAGLEPLRTDPEGRITAFRTWSVQCGPPPPEPPAPPAGQNGPEKRSVTTQPLPGLEIKGDNCIAREQGPVRAAAKASKAWEASPSSAHWVRDAAP